MARPCPIDSLNSTSSADTIAGIGIRAFTHLDAVTGFVAMLTKRMSTT
ncbi:hypothetical protein HNR62_001177 [Oceanisphaera litoralis]|nr:hypothetical protein [Oceanisphaera litoralis]